MTVALYAGGDLDVEPNTRSQLQYLDPSKVKIEGKPCEGMTIRAAQGNTLGDLHGFLVDPIGRKLRYLVVRTLKHTRFLPFAAARFDTAHGAIEVALDERDFRRARDVFPALSMLGSS
jgi:hypothetical protein